MNRLIMACAAGLLTSFAFAQTPATAPAAPAAAPPAAPPAAALAPAAGAEVYIISPKNGAKVHGPVTVRFGLKGMGIAPAGIKFDNTGHHHLLVDTDIKDLKLNEPMPTTDKILHFGKGQTETQLNLSTGKHTLELIFADYTHRSFDPPLHSAKITITVN
jgi:pyruvate/2-oxoglutarate dehydrogenase complex dihydrolipoamide acyltransferase (E2) component